MKLTVYRELEKNLAKIHSNKKYDLFKRQLEIEKEIDRFYTETNDLSEEQMALRFSGLSKFFYKRDLLYIPIVITSVFGLTVTSVFFLILSDFGALRLLFTFFMLSVLALLIFPLKLIFFSPEDILYQKNYEKDKLERMLKERLEYFKNGENEYAGKVYAGAVERWCKLLVGTAAFFCFLFSPGYITLTVMFVLGGLAMHLSYTVLADNKKSGGKTRK